MPRSPIKTNPSEQPAGIPGGALGLAMVPNSESDEAKALLPPLAQPEVRASAMREEDEGKPPAPAVKWYRVVNERRIMHRGSMTVLREGKELNELNYDVKHLERQGVRLQPIAGPGQ